MTIKELRAALDRVPTVYDDKNVVVWLPGSKIDLSNFAMALPASLEEGEIWVEGNVRAGSALDS